MKNVDDCFKDALTDEKKGKKHKGLLITRQDDRVAQEYVEKAKVNLGLCDTLKERGYDYKIPEEWFYTLYYCALAILAKFGVESRSQACTAAFLRYAKDKRIIEFDDEFIDRITVHREKEARSDVDERENARYSPAIKSEEVESKYDYMTDLCKKAISQTEDIIYSKNKHELPKELRMYMQS